MLKTVHIAVAVDAIGALSAQALKGYMFMMDDSIHGSIGKGTAGLVTYCVPGQIVSWKCYAVDLQTPVSIKAIDFPSCRGGAAPTATTGEGAPDRLAIGRGSEEDGDWANDSREWKGIVPACLVPGVDYHYRLCIQMGRGGFGTLTLDAPALRLAPGIGA